MVPGSKRIYIHEEPWDIIFEDGVHPDIHGDCHWDTQRIRIFREESSGKYDPETVVHELLHALFPKMSEDNVMRAGAELTSALCEINIHFKKGLVRGNKHI